MGRKRTRRRQTERAEGPSRHPALSGATFVPITINHLVIYGMHSNRRESDGESHSALLESLFRNQQAFLNAMINGGY